MFDHHRLRIPLKHSTEGGPGLALSEDFEFGTHP